MVNFPSGKILALDFKPSDNIENVKLKLQDKAHALADEQCLVVRGKQFQDGRTLADCNVGRHSSVDILPRVRGGMQIIVTTAIGKRVILEVNTSDTSLMVKAKASDMLGIYAQSLYQNCMISRLIWPQRLRLRSPFEKSCE